MLTAEPLSVGGHFQARVQRPAIQQHQVRRPAETAECRRRLADQGAISAAVRRADLSGPNASGFEVRLAQFPAEVPGQHAIERRPDLEQRRLARRTRRGTNQPEPQTIGLFEQLRRRLPFEPDGVETEFLQHRQRLAAMLDDSRKHWSIVDQQHSAHQFHRMPRWSRSGRGNPRGWRKPDDVERREAFKLSRRRRRGPLPTRRCVAGDFQVVDPHIGRSRPGVYVQQHRVEIRFPLVHLGTELQSQDVDLPGEQFWDSLDPQFLPASHGRVRFAGNYALYRLAGPLIDRAGQNDPDQELNARAIRFDPHAGFQVVDDRGATDVVGKVHVRPPAGFEPQPLAAFAGMGILREALVVDDSILCVAAGVAPGGLRSLEVLVPCPARTHAAGGRDDGRQQQSGQDFSSGKGHASAWQKNNTVQPNVA